MHKSCTAKATSGILKLQRYHPLCDSNSKGANRTISFTLSDSFCVSRHKDEWIDLIHGQVDILFGNEDEIKELSGCGTLTEAAQWIQGKVKVACLTLAERGSIIVTEDEIIGVGAKAVSQVIDSTGAGDLYASGFLFGYARGLDLKFGGTGVNRRCRNNHSYGSTTPCSSPKSY